MKAAEYWNRLNGYWTLFKDKPAFTIMWDAMIKASEEYAGLVDAVNHPGVLRCPDTVTLVWEKIEIAEGGVHIVNNAYDQDEDEPGDEYLDYTITSIPVLRDGFLGSEYTEDVDYSIDYEAVPPALTWIHADPELDSYLADTVSIDHGMLDGFYNDGLLDLDLSPYSGEAKWALYACLRHLGFQHTPVRMRNIMAILAGVPFSKFYGTFTKSEGNNSCSINYAVQLTSEFLGAGGYIDYADFLAKNELANYCLLDQETGDIYDGNFPDDGGGLTLCHKYNLGMDEGRYYIILPGETISDVTWDIPYVAGELYPIATPCDIGEYARAEQYDPSPIPIHITAIEDCTVTAAYPPACAPLIRDRELMHLSYVDNITIGEADIEITDINNIVIADPLTHILQVGEEIIMTRDDGESTYCSIISGYYNELEQTYHVTLTIELDIDASYSVTIPIHKDAMVYIEDIEGYMINFISDILSDDQMPVLRQCASNIAAQRVDNIYEANAAGDNILHTESIAGYAIGDIISVTSGGEQDFYRITNLFQGMSSADITVTPPALRGYSAGTAVYNHGTLLSSKRAVITADPAWEMDQSHVDNITAYMEIWHPGIEIYWDDDMVDPNISGTPTVYDTRFWQRLDKEAKKENKE